MEKSCYESGLSTQRHDISSVKKANGMTGCGDLLIKDANIGDNRQIIIGRKEVGRIGQLRDPDVNKFLEATARTKVTQYRDRSGAP